MPLYNSITKKTIVSLTLLVFTFSNIFSTNFENVYKDSPILSSENQEKTFTIYGKIVDKSNGETIPFSSVVIENLLMGTSSNELGEFEIKVNSLPTKLVFSHLNYEKQIVTISKVDKTFIIELTPLVYQLEEVTLSNKKDFYAYEIATKAFRRVDVNTKNKKFGKAYYRQKSKNGDEYSEFSEIIYDIRYSTEGIDEWDILEGRYALKGGTVNNKNYTLLSRILKSYQPNSEDLIFPLRNNMEDFYKVSVIDVINSKDGKIAVLAFEPMKNIKSPILEAEIYVNISNYDLLKIKATVKDDNFKAVSLKEKNAEKKNYSLTYEMTFKLDSVSSVVMDYMKVDQEFDYYKNDSLKTHVTSTSTLSFFEYYKPNERKRLGRQFYNEESDWQKLNIIGYNESFWKENPIIKRTPIEEEIIKSFERVNSFESIFLNSREQISITQSNISDDVFIKELDENERNLNSYNPVEKIYLHTDKDMFSAKEDIWFSAYVTLGTKHHYSMASKVLYIDLISPNSKIVHSQTTALFEGRGKGNITIPDKLEPGEYQIRAYTNWMKNFDTDFFFTKTITVIGKTNDQKNNTINTKIDLQFFPEGGNAIADLNNRIAFKAIGSDGIGIEVKGEVFDSSNKPVAKIITKEYGAGWFNLKPKPNESYTAVLSDNSRFPLPKIESTGYTMYVSNIHPNTITVKIQASENLRGKKVYVIGYIQNEKQYQGLFEFGGQLLLDFEIPKNKLPSGVMTLTVFTEEGTPMAERAIFINSEKELNILTKTNTTTLNPNDEVKVEISVTDNTGWPVETDLSVSITDQNMANKDLNSQNILTQILLQSDLKGHIENPGIYFNDKNRSTKFKQELVMLTHGWRKIHWEEIKKNKLELPKNYGFEQGLKVSGIALNSENQPLLNTQINMVANDDDQLTVYNTNTNNKGEFTFDTFYNTGKINVRFNAQEKSGKPIGINVALNPSEVTTLINSNFKRFNTISNVDYFKRAAINLNNDSLFKKKNTILDEVMLNNVKKMEKKDITNYDRDNMSGYNMVPDHTIYTKKISGENMLNFLADVPGLEYIQNRIHIRRNPKPALWLVDGVEILELPYNYSFGNLEKIEILKSLVSTAVYGPRGVNGVVIFKSKTANSGNVSNTNFGTKYSINGHAPIKEYYTPKFSPKTNENLPLDSRTTLYWNPMIRTDKNGKATIIFKNSALAKKAQLVIEGLSKFGNPGILIQSLGDQ